MSAARKKGITFDLVKDSYIGTLKKYAVFKGRARRREFWIFFLVNFVLGLIPGIGQLVSLLTCIPSMAVGVRRLHDTNRSGFWEFLALILPFVGLVFLVIGAFTAIASGGFSFLGAFAAVGSGGLSFFLIIAMVIFIVSLVLVIVLIVWATQEGTAGKNKYGSNPKARK